MSGDIAALVSENLDVWTGAVERRSSVGRGGNRKLSLYGIERLRALILDLAVRGKLVPQDAADEPAPLLLKRIDRCRAKLAEGGFLRGEKIDADRSSVEGPFSIPTSWTWTRLARLGAIVGGGTPSASDPTNFTGPGQGIAWLTPADLSRFEDKYIGRGQRDLTDGGLNSSSAKMMPAGTVLFTSRAPIGYVAIAGNPISTNQGFKSIVLPIEGMSEFVALALKAFAEEIDANAPGTTFKEVSGKIVGAIPFPLPPLAEQQRIVAKVDELMALCDALKAQSASATEAHQTLIEALLATLVDSANAADLATNWARLEAHFDTLFETEASIDALKQTVLELAVRGKLSEAIPTDEPAALLLTRVSKEITSYRQEQGIAPTKLEKIIKSEAAFAIPENWEWARLDGIFRVITDGDHQPPPKADQGIAFLTIGNVTTGKLDFEGCRFVPERYFRSLSKYRTPEMGDILYTVVGATFGRPALVETDREFCVQRHIAILKPARAMNLGYLVKLLKSPFVYNQASIGTTGTAQPTIALRPLRNFVVPIPPLAEQHRIVAKVDELVALCDTLKVRIAEAAETQRHLADAIVERAAA